MNGHGLFDRYIDGCNSNLLSEDIEEVYDFPRKKDDTSVDEKVKAELTSNVDTVTNMVLKMNNTPDEYDDEEGYSELDVVRNILEYKMGYKLHTDRLSAIEQLNPRIIVKRVADSDLIPRKNIGEPNEENIESISTKIFKPENINKLRQISKEYNISDEEFEDFLISKGYGTGLHSASFKSKYTPREAKESKLVAVPEPIKIKTNGKIDGSGNFAYYELEDNNKIGKKIVGPVGRFNSSYISTGNSFVDETTNTTFHIFRKETSADYLYGYFRDREKGDEGLSEKDVETQIGGNEMWKQRLGNALQKHSIMKGDRKANSQYYPFTYKDYFFVKDIDGTYVCIRVVTAQSKLGYREKGQLMYKAKSIDVVYLEGYILQTPPPSALEDETGNDKSMSEAKLIRYIDDTIAYISSNESIDPRTPDYKGFVADPNKYWVKMDSFINSTTVMINTLAAFRAIFKHIDMNIEDAKNLPDSEKSMYYRAEINLKNPERLKNYLYDFQKHFYGGNWRKIEGIEQYANNPKVYVIVRRWCIRQLEVIKSLVKRDKPNYDDAIRTNPKQFEKAIWKLYGSDISIGDNATSQGQDVMESIRRRLLEYCD